jgi:hypothetical protein
LALEFPVRPQRAFPPEQPPVQARLGLHRGPRLPLEGRLPKQPHLPGREHRRVRVRQHQGLTLRHRPVNVRVRLGVLRLEKSAGEPDQGKQNLREAEPEKSGAREPDRRKQNPRAVLSFRESPLGQPGNLHLKQPVPVKEQEKGLKRGLTESQKGPRARLLRRDQRSRNKDSRFDSA